MERPTISLPDVVERLSGVHASDSDPTPTDPFELIVWENVAYLAKDAQRAEAMARLRKTVGTTPKAIRSATPACLAEAAGLGILPDQSVRKLQEAAEIALRDFNGDLTSVLDLPVGQAKRALRRFPGIGEPGAEKILLLCRRHPFLAPESNALRVLVRLGLCAGNQSYAATYAAARDVAHEQLGDDIDLLISARHVLRRHGQVICRRSTPLCDGCLLESGCGFASETKRGGVQNVGRAT